MNGAFPEISVAGGQVDATRFVERGTGLALFIAFFVLIIVTLLSILVSQGIVLVALLIFPLIAWYIHKKAVARVHGSAVHVNEYQFPEIHRCVEEFKARLGIEKRVDVYVAEAGVMNAFAVRYGKRNMILLTDDLIDGCIASGHPRALAFVIGHELAHIALNHTGSIRVMMRKHMKKLGRLDEYSADSVATALVGDRATVFHGILLLTVGHALLQYVNPESIARQAQEVSQNKYSKKAERQLNHPLLLHRLQRTLNMQ